MFNRKSLKEFARNRLREYYGWVILVIFLAGLLGATGVAGLPDISTVMNLPDDSVFTDGWTDDSDNVWEDAQPIDPEVPNEADPGIWEGDDGILDTFPRSWEEFMESFNDDPDHTAFITAFLAIFAVVFVFACVFATVKTIFLGNVVAVGMNGWLLRFWRGEKPSWKELFACFRIYLPAMKAMFVSQLYSSLWSLLFLIPGIVKAYAYSLVPYIIYENPNLTANQAVALSEKLTRGYKWKLFVLDLSFIGWDILSGLTGGILGLVYVNPYRYLTYAGAYEQIKWNALQEGRVTWSDFGQMPPVDVWDIPTPPVTDVPFSEENV